MKKIKRYLQQQGWYLESKSLYDGKATLLGGNLLEGKMNLKKTVVFLIVCITFFSCDKFLEESPKDKLPEDEVYNNISDVYLNAVASLYTYIGGYSDSQGLQGTGRGVYDLNTHRRSHYPHPWRRLVRRRLLARSVPAPMGNRKRCHPSHLGISL